VVRSFVVLVDRHGSLDDSLLPPSFFCAFLSFFLSFFVRLLLLGLPLGFLAGDGESWLRDVASLSRFAQKGRKRTVSLSLGCLSSIWFVCGGMALPPSLVFFSVQSFAPLSVSTKSRQVGRGTGERADSHMHR